jgi:hypothetical protein
MAIVPMVHQRILRRHKLIEWIADARAALEETMNGSWAQFHIRAVRTRFG